VVLYFCLPPFVSVWLGDHFQIDRATVALLCINYYMTGARVPLGNVRSAAGIYEPDKWVPLAQSLTNIVVSVVAVQYWGLKGVYIGTLVSSFFPTIVRPIIIYKYAFARGSGSYFKTYIWRLVLLLCDVVLIAFLLRWINIVNPYVKLLMAFGVSAVVPAVTIILATRKSEEFAYTKNLMLSVVGPIVRKLKRRG
jgi:O-antigen/teichoic acid export membrane protein